MQKKYLISIMVFVLILAGCGPSPEQVATMTASAWTATPVPPTTTPTATPLPYGLSLTVTDSEANPIANAVIQVVDSDVEVLSDEAGKVSWGDFPAPNGTIKVIAWGYFGSEQTLNLSRGSNDLTVTLERDPNGLLASQACASGETPLYIEDFQDGNAKDIQIVNLNAGGWSIGASPELAANLVMTLALPDSYGGRVSDNEQVNLPNANFENAVMRFQIMVTGPGTYIFFWQATTESYQTDSGQVDWSRYMIHLGTTSGGRGDRASALLREQPPIAPIIIADRAVEYFKLNAWYLVEISTFDGNIKVWLDGKEIMNYVDPQPMPGGGFGMVADLVQKGAIAYYDNISVCGLDAPFTSLFVSP